MYRIFAGPAPSAESMHAGRTGFSKISDAGFHRAAIVVATLCCLVFTCLGLNVIPYPGIHNDEALFAEPLYFPVAWHAKISVFDRTIPTMLMSYVGAVKTWLYAPLLNVWAPSARSTRLPALLSGAATVWLFFLLLCRISGLRAGLIGAVLLTTDVCYLFTTTFDWGPVALQHLLCLSAVLSLVKFHQDGTISSLYLGFFVFGVGVWDKALFIWVLVGLAVAALIVFPGAVLRHFTWRRATLAAICFAIGAFPFILYNLQRPGDTIRSNLLVSFQGMSWKLRGLPSALDGSPLLGFIAAEDSAEHPRLLRTTLERFSIWLHNRVGEHRRGLNSIAFLVALILLPFFWRSPARQPLIFAVVFIVITWIQMAATAGAGGSVHHTILLWPFPLFFIAVAFAEASKRMRHLGMPLVTAAVMTMAGANLLVYNQHLAHLIRNGAVGSWTDAIFPLADRLPQYASSQIILIDWGMMNSLRLLGRGTFPLNDISFLLLRQAHPESEDKKTLLAGISDRRHLFVAHTVGLEEFKGVGAALSALARDEGYDPMPVATINDRNGRPVFELFHFTKRE